MSCSIDRELQTVSAVCAKDKNFLYHRVEFPRDLDHQYFADQLKTAGVFPRKMKTLLILNLYIYISQQFKSIFSSSRVLCFFIRNFELSVSVAFVDFGG